MCVVNSGLKKQAGTTAIKQVIRLRCYHSINAFGWILEVASNESVFLPTLGERALIRCSLKEINPNYRFLTIDVF
jgi:hypothetical protein